MSNLNLFYGEERFLIDGAIQNLKRSIIPEYTEPINFIELDGNKTSDDVIANACVTVPMMSEKKLVVVKNALFLESSRTKKNKNIDLDNVYNILLKLPKYTYVVFSCNKPDKRKKLYKLFNKKGVVKKFIIPNLRDKAGWIKQRAKKYGKKMNYSTAYFLAQYTKGLYQADEEIKKLVLFLGKRQNVQQSDLSAIFSKSIENNIFEMMDYVGAKRPDKAIEILNDLLMGGEKGILIVFMLSRHIVNLISVKIMEVFSFNEIRQNLKLHPFVLRKAIDQSKNFSLPELKRALTLCQDLDLDLKRGKIQEKIGLELLITKIAS